MNHLKSINEMFKIGNRINPVENPTNVYKLIVNNMSGDADHYEKTESFIGKEFEPFIKDVIELCNWSQKSWPNRREIEKKYKELQLKHKDFFDTIDLAWEPILTRDVTSDGDIYCRPEFVKLTWFDENGIEYKVETK